MSQLNKVVARYKDGRVVKGTTTDFLPGKAVFHLEIAGGKEPVEVMVEDLKAIFFVKEFDGNPQYTEAKCFSDSGSGKGKKIVVNFKDGEVLFGYTLGYDANRPGFFVVPSDDRSNNKRVYVVRSSVASVAIGQKAEQIGNPSGGL